MASTSASAHSSTLPTSSLTTRRIEQAILSIVGDLMRNRCPSLERENLVLKGKQQKSRVEWAYKKSRPNFAVLLFVMDKVHDLILKKAVRTKRDLFYENVTLFVHQRRLDTAVNNICEILRVDRALLHIEATAKGLIAGNIRWTGPKGENFDASVFNATGMLIPPNLEGHHSFRSEATFIVVVEKDAIFQKLLNDKIFDKLDPFILITGKGYPDYATRSMLHKLNQALTLTTFVLVDSDPHGIEIAAIYKWGSYGQILKAGYDSSFVSEQTVPNLIWLGMLPSEIINLGYSNQAIPLTNKDRLKLTSIEKRLAQQAGSESWLSELRIMAKEGKKAELETMDSRFLTEIYLKSRVEVELAALQEQD